MFAGQFTEALHDATLLAALGNKLRLLIGPLAQPCRPMRGTIRTTIP
jgi:hypothetical protein